MKNFILTQLILLISIAAVAQTGTDKVMYENANSSGAGTYTLDAIKTFVGGVTAPAAGIVKSSGTALQTAVAGTDYVLPSGNITGTAANITGVAALANGGTGGTTAAAARTSLGISLQTAVDGGATSTTAATFSGGITVGNFTKTVGAPITIATTLTAADYFREITSTTGITITITAGMATGKIIELPLATTAVGSYVINSTGTETFNGNSTYTLSANSGGTMIVLTKMSATNFRVSLRL